MNVVSALSPALDACSSGSSRSSSAMRALSCATLASTAPEMSVSPAKRSMSQRAVHLIAYAVATCLSTR